MDPNENEEYLDSLLKSLMESDTDAQDGEGEEAAPYDSEEPVIQDILDEDGNVVGETEAEEPKPVSPAGFPGSPSDDPGYVMTPDEIAAMFAAADEASKEDEAAAVSEEDDSKFESDSDLADLEELLKGFEGGESGDEEQEGAQGDLIDDDMLALLESASESEQEEGQDSDAFDLFSMEGEEMPEEEPMQDIPEEMAQVSGGEAGLEPNENVEQTEPEAGEADKEKKGRKGKKKRIKGKKTGEAENAENAGEGAEALEAASARTGAKTSGFFAKILAFLTETDEDQEIVPIGDEESGEIELPIGELSQENDEVLREIEAEDKAKKKEKKKAKKEKKGKKGAKQKPQNDGDEEAEEAEETEKTKKKKVRKKKEKKPKAAAAEPVKLEPTKKLSKKKIVVTAVFHLTLTAAILLLCFYIPNTFKRAEARDAYYQADYTKVYELLYGEELKEGDALLYNRADVICRMNRRLDSYQNSLSLGREEAALDSLLKGVADYPALDAKAQEYGVGPQVAGIYQQILQQLSEKYGLSEEECREIVDYPDDLTYTRRLRSIVQGTPFVDPKEEYERKYARKMQDVLTEEKEDIFAEDFGGGEPAAEEADSLADDSGPAGEAGGPAEVSMPAGEFIDNTSTYAAESPQGDAGTDLSGAAQEDQTAASGENQPVGSKTQGQQVQGLEQPVDVEIHED